MDSLNILSRWQEQDHGTIMPCDSFVPVRLAYNSKLDEGHEGY